MSDAEKKEAEGIDESRAAVIESALLELRTVPLLEVLERVWNAGFGYGIALGRKLADEAKDLKVKPVGLCSHCCELDGIGRE